MVSKETKNKVSFLQSHKTLIFFLRHCCILRLFPLRDGRRPGLVLSRTNKVRSRRPRDIIAQHFSLSFINTNKQPCTLHLAGTYNPHPSGSYLPSRHRYYQFCTYNQYSGRKLAVLRSEVRVSNARQIDRPGDITIQSFFYFFYHVLKKALSFGMNYHKSNQSIWKSHPALHFTIQSKQQNNLSWNKKQILSMNDAAKMLSTSTSPGCYITRNLPLSLRP